MTKWSDNRSQWPCRTDELRDPAMVVAQIAGAVGTQSI